MMIIQHVWSNKKWTKLQWENLGERERERERKKEIERLLERPRRRWEDNIKMDLMEVDCDAGDQIDLAEDRKKLRVYVRVVKNIRVP